MSEINYFKVLYYVRLYGIWYNANLAMVAVDDVDIFVCQKNDK
jgi:hypothetical protein